jgi:Tat protein secretion system quality control protein TatD with DNase activity
MLFVRDAAMVATIQPTMRITMAQIKLGKNVPRVLLISSKKFCIEFVSTWASSEDVSRGIDIHSFTGELGRLTIMFPEIRFSDSSDRFWQL